MRTLVTGSSGFVGTGLIRYLLADPAQFIVAASRVPPSFDAGRVHSIQVGGLGGDTDWRAALFDVDTVVHLAARVHVMRDAAADPLAEFRRTNVDGSLHLARQAAAAGVRRLVFVSSIKVNGELTTPGRPFRADDPPQPQDPYGTSKLEAEQALRQVADSTGLELVIVRPSLVYGPGVRANFRSMMGWLKQGIPLPFGAIDNRRSLVALDNLCDLIAVCMHHPLAPGHTFLAADGEDVSTSQLLRRLGAALGRPARLVSLSPAILNAALRALGRGDISRRLFSSLQVDISAATDRLGWCPPIALDEGLRRTAAAFLAETAR
jgi:nucleoside-diphosphate-sugar epimerase